MTAVEETGGCVVHSELVTGVTTGQYRQWVSHITQTSAKSSLVSTNGRALQSTSSSLSYTIQAHTCWFICIPSHYTDMHTYESLTPLSQDSWGAVSQRKGSSLSLSLSLPLPSQCPTSPTAFTKRKDQFSSRTDSGGRRTTQCCCHSTDKGTHRSHTHLPKKAAMNWRTHTHTTMFEIHCTACTVCTILHNADHITLSVHMH